MTSSTAFRIIASGFLIFAIIDRFVPSYADDEGYDFNMFQDRSVNSMVQKLFVKSFMEVTAPSADDVAKGSIYERSNQVS